MLGERLFNLIQDIANFYLVFLMTNGDFDIQGHFRTGARHPLLKISRCPGTRGTRTRAAPALQGRLRFCPAVVSIKHTVRLAIQGFGFQNVKYI